MRFRHRPSHPCAPRYRPCRIARRQASLAVGWCRRHLHSLVRIHQDPREHAQGHLRRRCQLIRLPHTKLMERDEIAGKNYVYELNVRQMLTSYLQFCREARSRSTAMCCARASGTRRFLGDVRLLQHSGLRRGTIHSGPQLCI